MPTLPSETHQQFNLHVSNAFASWLRDLAKLDRRTPSQELQYMLEMLFGRALWDTPTGVDKAFEMLTEMMAAPQGQAPLPVIPQGERGPTTHAPPQGAK